MSEDNDKKLPVIELFGPTVQGEGLLVGRPTHFLRLGGCGYKCTWCDSMHAVDPLQIKANRRLMTGLEIIEAVSNLPYCPWLTLTGGDPCIHKGSALWDLTMYLQPRGVSIAVETQGIHFPEWLHQADVVTFSPKGPSSEQGQSILQFRDDLLKFRQNGARAQICIKPVIFNTEDLQWAIQLYNTVTRTPAGRVYQHFTFQVGSPLTSEAPEFDIERSEMADETVLRDRLIATWKRDTILQRYQWLVGALLNSNVTLGPTVSITPQVHTLLWPTEEKGR